MEPDWLRVWLRRKIAEGNPDEQRMAKALLALVDLSEANPNPRAHVLAWDIRQTIVRRFDDEDFA